MKLRALILGVAAATAFGYNVASAQFGAGLGVAAVGDNVDQAGGELSDLFQKENITLDDVSGNIGFYVTGRARIPLGPIRLTGDLAYVYFQSKNVTLTDAAVNPQDSTVSATFEVGSSFIPVFVGAEFALPVPVVKPYIGAQVGYTYTSRTYTFASGNDKLKSLDLQNKSAGDPEFGMALNAGVELSLGVAALDVGARYNLSNLFSQSDDEKSMRFLQFGASVFF
jgi:hypothetical protein